jgi:Putative auto-transporter adhesin, head GIN domain
VIVDALGCVRFGALEGLAYERRAYGDPSAHTGAELAGYNNVIVQVGARQSVIVHADSNLLRRVNTRVRSGRLVIGTSPGNLNAKRPMFVTVSLPSIDRLRLQGAGNISVTGINSQKLTAALPGSGNIDATGTTTKLDVTISGEGTAQLRPLIARDAKAVLGGDGSIMLTARTVSPRGSQAAARSSMAAIPRASPRGSPGAARSALDKHAGQRWTASVAAAATRRLQALAARQHLTVAGQPCAVPGAHRPPPIVSMSPRVCGHRSSPATSGFARAQTSVAGVGVMAGLKILPVDPVDPGLVKVGGHRDAHGRE